jgi:hypothetical protein
MDKAFLWRGWEIWSVVQYDGLSGSHCTLLVSIHPTIRSAHCSWSYMQFHTLTLFQLPMTQRRLAQCYSREAEITVQLYMLRWLTTEFNVSNCKDHWVRIQTK